MRLVLRHAWLNLWDKHMTTGRINQVSRAEFKRGAGRAWARADVPSKEASAAEMFLQLSRSPGATRQTTTFPSVEGSTLRWARVAVARTTKSLKEQKFTRGVWSRVVPAASASRHQNLLLAVSNRGELRAQTSVERTARESQQLDAKQIAVRRLPGRCPQLCSALSYTRPHVSLTG